MGSEVSKRSEVKADDSKAKTEWTRGGATIYDNIRDNGKEFEYNVFENTIYYERSWLILWN